MLLENKNAVIYGGGGAVGGAVARAFAERERRSTLLGVLSQGWTLVAQEICAAGGKAETAEVDAMDERAVDRHADGVAAKAGGIDIALNAVGIAHVQGTPFAELSFEDYAHPITAYARTNFLTAKAVARHMAKQGSGVILLLAPGPGARMSGRGFLGNGVSAAAVEALSRILAGELGPSGIRVNCLRPHAIPEAVATSHTRAALQWHGRAIRIDHRGLAVGTRGHHVAGAPSDARRGSGDGGVPGFGSGRRHDRSSRQPYRRRACGLSSGSRAVKTQV